MFDPLSTSNNPFAEDSTPPWPTTPHTNAPIPNLRRASTPVPPTPDKGPAPGLYGKEPQIYGAPDSGLISPRESIGSNGLSFERTEPYLRVRITGLDRNRRDILIKFDAQTNLSNFTGSTYRNVSRSYIEFQQFYDAIVHNNPQTIVPALPLAQTSAPTDEEDDRLVRIMLQRWMSRVCEDTILIYDEDLRSFVESDFGYQPTPRPRKKTSSGFGIMRRGVPDEDEELQRARFELTKLEGQFFDTAKAVDKLALNRKIFAHVHAEMGNKLINVASTEAHPPLGNALRKLGRTWHSLADLDQAQALSECVIIGDSLGYQGMNARSAKETLQMRTGVLEEYQAAVKTTISKRRQIERLKASSSIRAERVDEALEEIEEANRYEQILARRAEGISQNLHRALQTHNKYANDDITSALIEHARSSIMYERQLLKELESLRGDVNNAAQKVTPNTVAPKPMNVPKLEDFVPRPPVPRAQPPPHIPASNGFDHQPQSQLPPKPPAHVAAPLPAPVAAYNNGDPLSPAFGSANNSLPVTPSISQQSLSGTRSPLSSAGPSSPIPQSPGAGSSKIIVSPNPSDDGGPPLGGRFSDGTRSMFVKPPSSPLATPAGPHSAGSSRMSTDPLMGSSTIGPGIGSSMARSDSGLDPLGTARPTLMTGSVRLPSNRPRLDAREAASKLANMF
ncbi:vacuolar protein sorting-associated protein vps17 [Cylindrobasidium torrendii FP15055 ss-10]|uniref:Vacuolar protein sorting-associated protein vps17 n=1 Tax=Cylindrobasidium torrendii FP15055 ss-10 TaxID=1314674 RepID=A0A0D7BI34_9AGAR|nr:vacuolar protein sorting-associated protein vps17 [Cylindrobasidium torrendii FP15055 ss-10]